MKYLILIFVPFLSLNAFTSECQVELPKVLIKEKGLLPTELDLKSDCPDSVLMRIKKFLCQNTGKFTAQQIARYSALQKEILKGKETNVYSVNDFINQHYQLPEKKSFLGTSFIGPQKFLKLTNKNDVKIQCPNCQQGTGKKNIKIVHNTKNPENLWLRSTVAFEVEAFFPTQLITPSMKKINQSSFIKRKTFSTNPAQLLSNINQIKFYEIKKTLDPNNPITRNDLLEKNLIKAGKKAKVIFKSEGINLSLVAVPLGYGRFGETVQLRNPMSNKIISGKVVDFNTVLVEL